MGFTVLWREAISQYLDHLRSANRSSSTIKLKLHYLERLARDLEDPWKATPAFLSNWIGRDGWSPETRKSARSCVAGFYAWACDYEHIDRNPARLLPPVRIPRSLPRPAPAVVLDRALLGASHRDRLMIMLGAYAGLRRAEIAHLKWVDVAEGCLRIVGKGDRGRLVPLLPALEAELHHTHDMRLRGINPGWRYDPPKGSPYVFPGSRGGHIHPDTVGQLLTEHLGGEWSGHTLRHRFATRAFAGTGDLRAVQELLGHSKPETTARYVAVADESLRKAVAAVA